MPALPGVVMPVPGFVDPIPGDMEPMPVALFMLFGPLAAEGEPAEFCMPTPLFVPMLEPLPVEVAWDGLALAAPVLAGEVGVLWPPMPVEPVPMVWAVAEVAPSVKAAAAIKIVFMLSSVNLKTFRTEPCNVASKRLTAVPAQKLRRDDRTTQSARTFFLRKEGFRTCLRRRMALGVTSTSSSSSM